ncbi:MAG: hypothetical protein GY925_17955, partial [Actinomycetia bacterium]|nr:hypothetical protein [Actinomycetes bacterium]
MSLNDGTGLDHNNSSSLDDGAGLSVEHQASLLDPNMDTLGIVRTVDTFTDTNYQLRPGSWAVRVRPEGVPTHQIWNYPQIRSADTVEEGLD